MTSSDPDRERLTAAYVAIDAANAEDPRREAGAGGEELPRELLYGRRMTAWLERLYPEAGTALRLAARAQHIRRWEIPRRDYPDGRTGYLRWRRELQRRHAGHAAAILAGVGYPPETIERVRALLQKQGAGRDPDVARLEDAICLVFLESELTAFVARHPSEKIVEILRKTWVKMTPVGQAAARRLALPEPLGDLLAEALGEAGLASASPEGSNSPGLELPAMRANDKC
ncbi:protein of unknown function [Tistlia consotensis]|uniref:DUF4202 domain-containing protein n=1 Tax=Tistlia consotensis USBA 355 TaxID=560819 RepID=A0A1Y6BYK1_9PROT|nr:DUF4202 domain-containing protein [Tistlia consotensis]SMF36281.1 protein of unknown function [Tistlia consotensis USBA 355]SNR71675.1 protein of unknown function [Tistlia consotensis]